MAHARDDFIVEIGTEELPPKSLFKLANCFKEKLEQIFLKLALPYQSSKLFATPRRLVVLIEQLAFQQQNCKTEKFGPAKNLAYDAQGQPTAAAIGFAKSCGTSLENLTLKNTPKGECLYYQQTVFGKNILELAPEAIKKALEGLPIPKLMRWGDRVCAFVRPVHWILLMYGKKTIPCTLFEIPSGSYTYGHRFHHPSVIEIESPQHYEQFLQQKGFVIPSYQKRKASVKQQIVKLAEKKGRVLIDADLLEEVTSIVEWPIALMGNFKKKYLKIPQEALIMAMKVHQKSFPIVDSSDQLLPSFITIANIESTLPHKVIQGNERVMQARLADATFFFETDLKRGLSTYVDKLKTVIFHNKLGTLYDKAQRLSKLAAKIATAIGCDPSLAARAGLLCKADLLSEMVGEFPDLQGIMGYHYALHNNETIDVAIAAKEHYNPKYAGDILPSLPLCDAVALADRLDTIVAIFSIAQQPSGDKDPFALRRAALGVLRIIIEHHYYLNLETLLKETAEGFEHLENPMVVTESLSFIMERLRAWYQEKNTDADVFAAVLARYPTSPYDFNKRIEAVSQFKQLPEANALAAANKRVSHILKKIEPFSITQIDENLLELTAEKELVEKIKALTETVNAFCKNYHYTEALTALAQLREPVDHFFDQVLVLAPDPLLKANRLKILQALHALFLEIADISLLQAPTSAS